MHLPPSHQVAYPRTLHEWTLFDISRSLHRQSLRTACIITYDIVEFDEPRDYPISMIFPCLDEPFQFHKVAAVVHKERKKNIPLMRLGAVGLVPPMASVPRLSEDLS